MRVVGGESVKEETRQLFRQRMKREDREAEFDERIAAHRTAGKTRVQSIVAAMRDMGYRGPKTELNLHHRAVARAMMDRRREGHSRNVKRYRAKKRMEDVEAAILSLKHERAPVEEEWNWVRNHMAMTRKKRQEDKTQDVVVTVKDILSPGQGPAPSRAAATMLINYVNIPDEFYKLVLGEDKKSINANGPGASETKDQVSDDLSNLKRVHAQFLAQQAAKQ